MSIYKCEHCGKLISGTSIVLLGSLVHRTCAVDFKDGLEKDIRKEFSFIHPQLLDDIILDFDSFCGMDNHDEEEILKTDLMILRSEFFVVFRNDNEDMVIKGYDTSESMLDDVGRVIFEPVFENDKEQMEYNNMSDVNHKCSVIEIYGTIDKIKRQIIPDVIFDLQGKG